MAGLTASAIARRKPAGEPVLEKYVFIPNVTTLKTEESIRVNVQIILENLGGIKVKVYEVFDENSYGGILGGIVFEALNDQPLIQPEIIVLTKKEVECANVTVQEGFLPKEKDASLVIGTNVLSRVSVSDLERIFFKLFLLYSRSSCNKLSRRLKRAVLSFLGRIKRLIVRFQMRLKLLQCTQRKRKL